MDEMREKLAEYAHNAWSGWMKYMFQKSHRNTTGTVTIPKHLVDRWTRQMITPYSGLPLKEKKSDREEADQILAIVREEQ